MEKIRLKIASFLVPLFCGFSLVSCSFPVERVPPSLRPPYISENAGEVVLVMLADGKLDGLYRYEASEFPEPKESVDSRVKLPDFALYDFKAGEVEGFSLPVSEGVEILPTPTQLVITVFLSHPRGTFLLPLSKSLPKPVLTGRERFGKIVANGPAANNLRIMLHAPEMLVIGNNIHFRVYADLEYPAATAGNRHYRIVSHVSAASPGSDENEFDVIYAGVSDSESKLFSYIFRESPRREAGESR